MSTKYKGHPDLVSTALRKLSHDLSISHIPHRCFMDVTTNTEFIEFTVVPTFEKQLKEFYKSIEVVNRSNVHTKDASGNVLLTLVTFRVKQRPTKKDQKMATTSPVKGEATNPIKERPITVDKVKIAVDLDKLVRLVVLDCRPDKMFTAKEIATTLDKEYGYSFDLDQIELVLSKYYEVGKETTRTTYYQKKNTVLKLSARSLVAQALGLMKVAGVEDYLPSLVLEWIKKELTYGLVGVTDAELVEEIYKLVKYSKKTRMYTW